MSSMGGHGGALSTKAAGPKRMKWALELSLANTRWEILNFIIHKNNTTDYTDFWDSSHNFQDLGLVRLKYENDFDFDLRASYMTLDLEPRDLKWSDVTYS